MQDEKDYIHCLLIYLMMLSQLHIVSNERLVASNGYLRYVEGHRTAHHKYLTIKKTCKGGQGPTWAVVPLMMMMMMEGHRITYFVVLYQHVTGRSEKNHKYLSQDSWLQG
jgi:hypothetical protein